MARASSLIDAREPENSSSPGERSPSGLDGVQADNILSRGALVAIGIDVPLVIHDRVIDFGAQRWATSTAATLNDC